VTEGQILGCDAAGVVVAHGEGAPELAPPVGAPVVVHSMIRDGTCAACLDGQELFCVRLSMLSEGPNPGTLAELVAVPTANLIPRPDSLSAVDAACLPTAYLTAYRMLFTRVTLPPGSTVLVQGSGGGVATATIVLARVAGIRVIASSRNEARRAAAVELGADAAVPSERGAHREVLRLTGGHGVDAVVESVGEPTWDMSLRSVRPGGTVLVCGATGGGNPPTQLARVYWRHLNILGSTMGTRAELEALVSLAAAGTFRPLVDATYALTDAARGLARLAAGEHVGKVVIVPGS
jgi:NADPH:quinone reductase-like Zn-dependent oxidoreductase